MVVDKLRCPQADGDKSAGNWPTAHDAVHIVFVNEEPESLFMFVVSATEVWFLTFLGGCFSDALPPSFTESYDVPVVYVHLMGEFIQLACFSQCSYVPCASNDVAPDTDLVVRHISRALSTSALVYSGRRGPL